MRTDRDGAPLSSVDAEDAEQEAVEADQVDAEELLTLALGMEPIPQQAGHVYTGICPVCGTGH
jgi:hypothetical protein